MTKLLILSLVVFIVGTLLFRLVIHLVMEKRKFERRLRTYIEWEDVKRGEERKGQKEKSSKSPIKKLAKAIEAALNLSKNEKLLLQSGVNLSLGELFIGRVIIVILVLMIGNYYEMNFLIVAIMGVIGFYLPIFYVKRRRKKRLELASYQLGEALGVIANAMRAGFSFMQAMKMVADEIEEPLGPEFLKTLQEINLGLSYEDAFQNLLDRLPEKELEIVLNTLIVQRKTGGNMAYLLETMQNIIFDRARVKGEVKTLTAQGKMSSVIITILPLALALYIRLVNPEYFQKLFSHPVGWVMVIYGSFSIIFGWLWIKKIVNIEV
ncbi:type II secretion system F family protein [Sporosarcina sp. ACRSL]|uniref:type II secretion system F family protein n=1 Tax=Sporosarcina sp. ACRSL TaxID=2918215 RepID=UPI001EF470A4|nr:type II secretion system F family protein [Sporosarcina sp. ACRSL]MCG7344141.1 type II secretion system F family protein [Sporosarcina sp. ACRSL]